MTGFDHEKAIAVSTSATPYGVEVLVDAARKGTFPRSPEAFGPLRS